MTSLRFKVARRVAIIVVSTALLAACGCGPTPEPPPAPAPTIVTVPVDPEKPIHCLALGCPGSPPELPGDGPVTP